MPADVPQPGDEARPHSDSVTIPLRCSVDAIRAIDVPIRDALKNLGLDSGLQTRLRLIVEEMLTNLVMHGDPPPGGEATLTLSPRDDTALQIEWTDPGRPFDPRTDLPAEDLEAELEDRRIGGLGWPLILAYCTIESYAHDGDCNRLRLVMKHPD